MKARRSARTAACRVHTLQKAREGTSVQRMQIETSGCAEIHFARVAEKRAFCRQRRSQQGSLVARVNVGDSEPRCSRMDSGGSRHVESTRHCLSSVGTGL